VTRVKSRHAGLAVTSEAVLGWAPSVVRSAAATAALLVVGRSEKTKGRFGEWSPDTLGRHVRCPIVFVP
jgi:hypothetical protein